MYEIFLDTETTGLSTEHQDRIVEIACIETKNLMPTKNVFYYLINPEGKKVSPDAFKVHGYSDEFLKNQKPFKEICHEFLRFIEGKKIIIHNAKFDLGFLNYELGLLGKQNIDPNVVIDSLEVARTKFPGSPNSLDALCKRFGIDLSKRTKHNALLDCELLREAYINMIGQKEPQLFSEGSSNNTQEFQKSASSQKTEYCKQIVKPTPAELEQFNNFLKQNLKKNFYKN